TAGDGGDGFHRVGDLAARTAQGGVDAHAQQLRLGDMPQDQVRVALAQVDSLGIGVQPLSKCGIKHVPSPLRNAARTAPRAAHADGCQRYLPSSSLSGVWANTLAKLHRVARLTPRITSRALPSL